MTSTRRPQSSHVSATLLALAVAVSLGGGVAEARAAAPVQGETAPARTSQATLLQRLTEAARSLIAEAERAVVKPDRHRPALRSTLARWDIERQLPGAHTRPLHAHLLNLPPPARA